MDLKIRLNNYQPSSSTLAKIVVGVVLAAFLGFLIGPLGLVREFAWGGLKLLIGIAVAAVIMPIPFKLMKQADGTPAKKISELFKMKAGVVEQASSGQDRQEKHEKGSRSYARKPYQPGPGLKK